MANRSLIGVKDGTLGYYISKPGVNVLTATPDQLIFDSRLGYYGSVVASGSATSGSTINFPAMEYIPMAFVYVTSGGNNIIDKYWSRTIEAAEAASWSGYPIGEYVSGFEQLREPYYKISTSQLILTNTPYQNASGQTANSYTARYIIWRLPGA